jgi:hypothetical protein
MLAKEHLGKKRKQKGLVHMVETEKRLAINAIF